MIDVLLSQRVCRQWHGVIKNSDALQEHLYFKIPELGSLGSRRRNDCKEGEEEFNPLLKTFFPTFYYHKHISEARSITRSMLYELDWFKDEDRRAKFLRREASWRKMLTAQDGEFSELRDNYICRCPQHPPQKYIYFSYRYQKALERRESLSNGRFGAHDPRFGIIWDLMAYLLDKSVNGNVMIQWINTGGAFRCVVITLDRGDPCRLITIPLTSGLEVTKIRKKQLTWQAEARFPIRPHFNPYEST
jgi:hypothetical protein